MIIFNLPNGLIYNLSDWNGLKGYAERKGNDIELNIVVSSKDFSDILLSDNIYNIVNSAQILPSANDYLQKICRQIAVSYGNGNQIFEFPIDDYKDFLSRINKTNQSQEKMLFCNMIQQQNFTLANGTYFTETDEQGLKSISNDMVPFERGMIFYYKEPMGVYNLVYFSGRNRYNKENCQSLSSKIQSLNGNKHIIESCDIFNYDDGHFEITVNGLRADYLNEICQIIDKELM